jgi:hypothetical protein
LVLAQEDEDPEADDLFGGAEEAELRLDNAGMPSFAPQEVTPTIVEPEAQVEIQPVVEAPLPKPSLLSASMGMGLALGDEGSGSDEDLFGESKEKNEEEEEDKQAGDGCW